MASFQYAGMYGPETILDQTGALATGTSVEVYEHGTSTIAQLYTPTVTNGIETLPVPLSSSNYGANPVLTDNLGNLVFWAAPGVYDLVFTIQGVQTTKVVVVESDPADLAATVDVSNTFSSGAINGRYAAWSFTTVNTYANNTNNSFTVGTLVLARPALLRMAANWTAAWSPYNSISANLALNGVTYGADSTAEIDVSGTGQNIFPMSCKGATGGGTLAAGSYAVTMQFNVGGGGASVTIANLFVEIEAVG